MKAGMAYNFLNILWELPEEYFWEIWIMCTCVESTIMETYTFTA